MCHTLLAQVVLESVIPSPCHPWWAFLSEFFDLSFSFHPHFLVFFLSFLFMHSDLYSDDLDSVTNNLRDSAKGSNDGYDVAFSLTGYEPNDTELQRAHWLPGSLFHVTPSLDQDMDDTTLGKLFTEIHRDYADYRCPEGERVSPSSLSVASDRTGKPVGKSNIDQFSLVSETRAVLTISFLQSPKLKKWSIERGNPWKESLELLRSGKALAHRLGLCSMNEDEIIIAECCEKVLITNSKQVEHNKIVKFYIKHYDVSKWIFVKFINKVLLRWRNHEIPEFYFRYDRKTKAHRGPENYYGTIWKITRIAKWSKLYERF